MLNEVLELKRKFVGTNFPTEQSGNPIKSGSFNVKDEFYTDIIVFFSINLRQLISFITHTSIS